MVRISLKVATEFGEAHVVRRWSSRNIIFKRVSSVPKFAWLCPNECSQFWLCISLLATFRCNFLQFPFHPLGFAIVTAYGDPLWGAFLSAWLLKLLITRLGEFGLYRKLIPGFWVLLSGISLPRESYWGILGAVGNDIFRSYGVWFGWLRVYKRIRPVDKMKELFTLFLCVMLSEWRVLVGAELI